MGDRLYHPYEWVIGGYNVIFGRINRLGLAFADRGQTGGYNVPFVWKSTVRLVVGFLAGITDWVLLLQTGGRVAIVRNGL